MADSEITTTVDEKPSFNPWVFIPLLYFMQSLPVSIIQELSTIIYKDLGIANEEITRWTSIIALPWGLQMLLGPFVDLNFTKRGWILGGQLVIAVGLSLAAFSLKMPQAFHFSLVVFGLTGIFSALCNIATDGFALLSMTKQQQAMMAGFMSTFYRFGRLFVSALLVFAAGKIMTLAPLNVSGASMTFKKGDTVSTIDSANLVIREGKLADVTAGAVEPELKVPNGVYELSAQPDGTILGRTLQGEQPIGKLEVSEGASIQPGAPVKTTDPATAWFLVMLVAVVVYALGRVVNHFTVPKPPKDELQPFDRAETKKNLARTGALIGLGLGGYFLINSIVRLVAHGLWAAFDGKVPPPDTKNFDGLQGWRLPDANKIPFLNDLSFGGVGTEVFQFVVCAAIVLGAVRVWKRMIAGSEMGESLISYVRQPGFAAIFFFIFFYRFPEAMVGKITPLFLKDSLDHGGLAIGNAELGILNGVLGVVGIILGGIAGGLTVSKLGLRKSFIPLALAMHVPNLLYLGLYYKVLPGPIVDAGYLGQLNLTVGLTLLVDQFGYGFGFAGYMVYIMWVAQRGRFTTSHYAIGTGMGALTIATAGVLSGVVYQAFVNTIGYAAVYWAVLVLSIPGLAALFFVPLDESHKQIKAELAD